MSVRVGGGGACGGVGCVRACVYLVFLFLGEVGEEVHMCIQKLHGVVVCFFVVFFRLSQPRSEGDGGVGGVKGGGGGGGGGGGVI